VLIGIVADIHEEVELLERALDELRNRGAQCIVTLGDACDTFGAEGRAHDVVALLRQAGAVGVWGNHNVGLCTDVTDELRCLAKPGVLEYMATLKPQLVLEGCRFSHVEPWLDPHRVEDLWYFDGPPVTPEKVSRSFAAVPERHLFVGHFHRWLVTSETGGLQWDGSAPIHLHERRRYLTVVAPVMGGWCATFDTQTCCLTPIRFARPVSAVTT
jgi:hypothetical protein